MSASRVRRTPPKKLLRSCYREELWKNARTIVRRVEKVLPIASMHLMGGFTSRKRRPADVDFIVLLKTPVRRRHQEWSLDLVIAPDNAHGEELLQDCAKWVRQKYGAKNSKMVRMK